jgi:hypothetical protein
MKPPIIICSKTQKTLPVLLKSIECYVPEDVEIYLCCEDADYAKLLPKHKVKHFVHTYDTGGKAWNFLTHTAFKEHTEVVACADDVVLNPDSYQKLIEDVNFLKTLGNKIGLVCSRTNYAKGYQNVRMSPGQLMGLTYESESQILPTDYLAGIFGWAQKLTWIPCPPIDWYSDDIVCMDMNALGCTHYVSRSYIHHIGSVTYGHNFKQLSNDSRAWIEANRPELVERFFKCVK